MLQTPPDSASPTIPRFRLPPDQNRKVSPSYGVAPHDNDACRYQLPSLSFSPPAVESELWGAPVSSRPFEEPYNALLGDAFVPNTAHPWHNIPSLNYPDNKWGAPNAPSSLVRSSRQPLEEIYAPRNQRTYNSFYNPAFAFGSAYNKPNYVQRGSVAALPTLAPSRTLFMHSNIANESHQRFASSSPSQFTHPYLSPPLAYPHSASSSASRTNSLKSQELPSLSPPKTLPSTQDVPSRAQPRSDEVSNIRLRSRAIYC
jgi:hypothetical protein